MVLQDVVELLWGQIFEVSAVDDTGLGISGGKTKPLSDSNSYKHHNNSTTKADPERDPGVLQVHQSLSVPWVNFVDWDVQTCSDVLNGLVAFGDDAHTLSNGLSCDWMITCDHDDLRRTHICADELDGSEGNTLYILSF